MELWVSIFRKQIRIPCGAKELGIEFSNSMIDSFPHVYRFSMDQPHSKTISKP